MKEVNITRWIDMNSADYERIEKSNFIRKIVRIGIDAGIIKVDAAGYMWQDGVPVHAELDGGLVGLRLSALAGN